MNVESTVSTPMIRLVGVSKRYLVGGVVVAALEDLDLEIARGELIAVVGPSGSGKSTMMVILGALDTPTEGTYLLEGQDISRLPDALLSRIRNEKFGFVFQSYNLFAERTALENVELPLMYAGVPARERRARAHAQLEAVGLGARAQHRPAQLSGGQQQRVAIARAFVSEPTLILADEPTGNLSRRDGDEILEILLRLNTQGATVVLVTHDQRVASLARRQLEIEDGRLRADRTPTPTSIATRVG